MPAIACFATLTFNALSHVLSHVLLHVECLSLVSMLGLFLEAVVDSDCRDNFDFEPCVEFCVRELCTEPLISGC